MRRKKAVKNLPSESSDDDEPLAKKLTRIEKPKSDDDESSSESDIENYLQPADKIDLDSPFFSLQKDNPPSFDKIENDIFAGVTRLSDSDSEVETPARPETVQEAVPSTSKVNFRQLHEYTKKLEETKKHVEEYNARKRAEEKQVDVSNLLAAGESKSNEDKSASADLKAELHDFESCSDSENEGWEEVKENQKDRGLVPKENLEITVEMPGALKKKKGVDLLAAIKRRINKVKKDTQILIHKVHLLCWIAHGNYVSSAINSQNVLAVALSLLPSQQCYPAHRTDLNYLEQVLKWFKNAVLNVEKPIPKNKTLQELLESQITKKEAYNKKMLVYIFVAILRSLGIQCRLVLSFQAEPLRPPNSELCSLSTKSNESKPETVKSKKNKEENKPNQQKSQKIPNDKKPKSSSTASKPKIDDKKTPSKNTNETKQKETSKVKIEDTKVRIYKPKDQSADPQKINIKNKRTTKSENKADRKDEEKKTNTTKKTTPKSTEENKKSESKIKLDKLKKHRAKSSTDPVKTGGEDGKKSRSSSLSDKPNSGSTRTLRSRKEATKIPQMDGANDSTSDDELLLQVDGANDRETASKPNLKKLKGKETTCPITAHPKRLKAKATKYRDSETDSEDDFKTKSPFSDKNSPQTNGSVNLKKLKGLASKSKTPPTPEKTAGSKFFGKKTVDVRNDIIDLVKSRIKEQKQIDRSKTVRKRKSAPEDDEDSDYVPETVKKKHRESEDDFAPAVKVKRRVQVKSSEEDAKQKKQGNDVWAEVFLETEEKWISVDVVKGQVHCVSELFTRATHPVSYIVAWNNDNSLKDITSRYCKNFNTVTRKLRIDSEWWKATMKPFTGRKTARDREEDEELERQQLEKPLPTSISEYKNHPLYVLKRHLLKFEAIYPPDAPTLGFIRSEPVYSRQCVYVLHSRDIWLKHAKVVKPGEKPYKIVKARPKWDKLSNKVITDLDLEVFGPWQTQDYEPPTAENGVVPRNAFGNVELFKPSMLPKKTVHLQLPGLNKVARRMNIDCASAVTGFDFHGGWNHPVYDGFVVCEEFADILVAAWELEQEENQKKEREKIDKRVYGNWKKLIRGLLIRERLKVKYEFGEISGGKKKAKSAPKSAGKERKGESTAKSD